MKNDDLFSVFGSDFNRKTQAMQKQKRQRKPKKQYSKTEVQDLIKKMSQLDIMKEEIKQTSEI